MMVRDRYDAAKECRDLVRALSYYDVRRLQRTLQNAAERIGELELKLASGRKKRVAVAIRGARK